jgi:hypothetical protein
MSLLHLYLLFKGKKLHSYLSLKEASTRPPLGISISSQFSTKISFFFEEEEFDGKSSFFWDRAEPLGINTSSQSSSCTTFVSFQLNFHWICRQCQTTLEIHWSSCFEIMGVLRCPQNLLVWLKASCYNFLVFLILPNLPPQIPNFVNIMRAYYKNRQITFSVSESNGIALEV